MKPALQIALERNDKGAISAYVTETNVNDFDKYRETVVMYAVRYCDEAVLQDILKKRPSLSTQNGGGETALMLAIELKHYGKVRALLKAGAADSLSLSTPSGNTALLKAVHTNHTYIVRALLPYLSKDSLLHTNSLGTTALMIACQLGNPDILKDLCDALKKLPSRQTVKDYINQKNTRGTNALFLALDKTYLDVENITALIDMGADLYAKNAVNQSILEVLERPSSSSATNKKDVLKLLLRKGAGLSRVVDPSFFAAPKRLDREKRSESKAIQPALGLTAG